MFVEDREADSILNLSHLGNGEDHVTSTCDDIPVSTSTTSWKHFELAVILSVLALS